MKPRQWLKWLWPGGPRLVGTDSTRSPSGTTEAWGGVESVPTNGSGVLVAQIFNLLYRRIPFGRAGEVRAASGLEIRDTAGRKPALRGFAIPFSCLSWVLLVAVSTSAQSVSNPYFTPPSGTRLPVTVTISNTTPGSSIHFTLDGTVPDTNATLYTAPLTFSNYTSLRARAFQSGLTPSDTVSANYLDWPDRPGVSYQRVVTNDLPNQPLVTVTITGASNVACFTIEERLPTLIQATNITGDGTTTSNNAVRWGPFTNTPTVTVSYRVTGMAGTHQVDGAASVDGAWTFSPSPSPVTITALGGGGVPSVPPQVAMPIFAPASGSNVPVDVTLSCGTTGAVIYYTLDGSLPSQASTLYTGAVHLASASAVRARAFTNGWTPSVASVAYYEGPLPSADIGVARSVGTNPPTAPVVSFTVTPATNATCWTMEEWLPPGLGASNVTADGVFSASSRVVRWGPFFGSNAVAMSYQAVGLPGSYPVHATWSVDGMNANVNRVRFQPTQTFIANWTFDTAPAAADWSTASLGGSFSTAAALDGAVQALAAGSIASQLTASVSNPPAATALATWSSSGFYVQTRPTGNGATLLMTTLTNTTGGGVSTLNINYDLASPVVPANEELPGHRAYYSLSGTAGSWVAVGNYSVVGSQSISLDLSATPWAANTLMYFLFADDNAMANPDGSYQIDNFTVAITSVPRLQNPQEAIGCNVVVASPTGGSGVPTPPSQVPTPVLSPALGTNLPVTVAISCTDAVAQIRFTLDGSLPTEASALYSTALQFSTPTTLRARAFRVGYTPSVAVVGYYQAPSSGDSLGLVRAVSGNGTFLPAITITATPQGSVGCYAVTETLASGLTPYEIGQDAVWNETNRTLKWGPYPDATLRVMSYKVSGPSATYALAGQGSFDGNPVLVTGATAVTVDLNTMPVVATPVITPTPNGVFPVNVTISCATTGAVIHFTIDGTDPDESAPVYAGPVHLDTITLVRARAFRAWSVPSASVTVLYGDEQPAGGTTIGRTITSNGKPLPLVQITVHPGTGVQCHAVTEVLPVELRPLEVSHGGVFSAATRTVRWGPFLDAQERTLSFRLSGPDGSYELSGSGSFDGFSRETTGDRIVVVDTHSYLVHAAVSNSPSGPTVQITATPSPLAACYTVEEFLPPGVTPQNISDGGLWNASTLTIKWGPFLDDAPRMFNYDPIGATNRYLASGRISVDGVSHLWSGEVTVQTLLVFGEVELDWYAGPARDGRGNRAVTFKATEDDGTVLATWNLPLDFAPDAGLRCVAGYALANVPSGATHLSAKTAWSLRKRLPVVLAGESGQANFTASVALPGGDLDGSNAVDLGDYSTLAGSWYAANPAADLDGNSRVDLDDYFLLSSRWQQTGDPE